MPPRPQARSPYKSVLPLGRLSDPGKEIALKQSCSAGFQVPVELAIFNRGSEKLSHVMSCLKIPLEALTDQANLHL